MSSSGIRDSSADTDHIGRGYDRTLEFLFLRLRTASTMFHFVTDVQRQGTMFIPFNTLKYLVIVARGRRRDV